MFKTREEMFENPIAHERLVAEFLRCLDKKKLTKKSYGGFLRRYLKYLNQNHIVKPDEAVLIDYKEYLSKNGCSGTTCKKYVVILRRFYKWCENRDYYPNITVGLEAGKIESKFVREPLSIEEVRKLLKFAKDRKDKDIRCLRDYAIVNLIIKTGLRTIEVSEADVTDVVTLKGTHYLFLRGKGHDEKDERVKLPDSVYDVIQEYLMKRNSDCKSLFVTTGPRSKNKGIQPYTVSIIVKHLLRAIGLDDKRYTAHSLRHTCATIALLNGAKFEEVQMVLRHRSIETTTIYAHAIKRETNNVEFIVEDAIEKEEKK